MTLLDEPLELVAARSLVRQILTSGAVHFSRHADARLDERAMSRDDCLNVLRAGEVTQAILESGTWRYRVETPRMVVMSAFRDEETLVVVTAWRKT